MLENNVTDEMGNLDLSSLNSILGIFSRSIIQSEAEVRSKLIVPIIEWLGYPVEFRSEEFPVYSFDGSKPRPAKNADFIMFDDKHFSLHRNNTKTDIEWVQEHSLLVFEAKKKGEMPELLGQPQFYTTWTKAVAYLVSDGERICAYYYSLAAKDYCVLDCLVKDLAQNQDILLMSFDNIRSIKSQYAAAQLERIARMKKQSDDKQVGSIYVTEKNLDLIPDELTSAMAELLEGKAEGLGKLETILAFLDLTDTYLQHSIRYNIPEYMMRVPRSFFKASIFLDNSVLPSICGTVTEFYRNESEVYYFSNEYLNLYIMLENKTIVRVVFGYHLSAESVAVRISQIEQVKSLLNAKSIRLVFDNAKKTQTVNIQTTLFEMDIKKERICAEYWAEELVKMKCIEDYYQIRFKLKPIHDEELIETYSNVDYVYKGIAKIANCHRILPGYGSISRIKTDEPILIESVDETGPINMTPLRIHNYNFIPKKIYLPVGVIQTSKQPFAVDFCAVLEPQRIIDDASVSAS